MKIAYIQHVPYEDLGVIDHWAQERQLEITAYKPFMHEALPHLDEFDFLIILGGPQSARHVDQIDYLQQEVEFIKKAMAADKYVLGICLGAQLMGVAQGSKAKKSPEPEMGCFPIELTDVAKQDRVMQHFPEQFDSLHWHFDMIGVPDGATVLARSNGCPVQAVKFSDKAYGLQCHLEFNRDRMRQLIEKSYHNLPEAQYVQDKAKILEADFAKINDQMKQFLDAFMAGVQGHCR